MNVLLSFAPPSPGKLMAYNLGLKLYLYLLVPSSAWWDQDFTWEFSIPSLSSQIHNHRVVPLYICMHRTCFSALEMQYEMKIRFFFKVAALYIFGALKNEHCSVFFKKHCYIFETFYIRIYFYFPLQCCILFSMFKLKWIYCSSFCMKIILLSFLCILLER